MSKIKSILFYYDFIFTIILFLIGIFTKVILKSPTLLIIIIPLIVYFISYLIINSKRFKTPQNQSFWICISLLLIYNLLATTLLFISTLAISKTFSSIIITLLYFPYPLYFFLTIYHWFKKLKTSRPPTPKASTPTNHNTSNSTSIDPNRRQFLKLLGGTSLSLIVMSLLNPKQAGAAFFGSVPGPGTISLKDANGIKINPAEKQPTDGYKISQIDDSNYPYYYGYINQSGSWYIMREDDQNNYRYTKGDTDFSTNWTGRATLSYGYFDSIF